MTSEAKTMLYDLYKEYKNRRFNGWTRAKSKFFGSSDNLQKELFQYWLIEDIEDIMRELGREGYLANLYASDRVYNSSLTDAAISKLENQPKETLMSIADFVSKFIP